MHVKCSSTFSFSKQCIIQKKIKKRQDRNSILIIIKSELAHPVYCKITKSSGLQIFSLIPPTKTKFQIMSSHLFYLLILIVYFIFVFMNFIFVFMNFVFVFMNFIFKFMMISLACIIYYILIDCPGRYEGIASLLSLRH